MCYYFTEFQQIKTKHEYSSEYMSTGSDTSTPLKLKALKFFLSFLVPYNSPFVQLHLILEEYTFVQS